MAGGHLVAGVLRAEDGHPHHPHRHTVSGPRRFLFPFPFVPSPRDSDEYRISDGIDSVGESGFVGLTHQPPTNGLN